jgi:hypothetical protein
MYPNVGCSHSSSPAETVVDGWLERIQSQDSSPVSERREYIYYFSNTRSVNCDTVVCIDV